MGLILDSSVVIAAERRSENVVQLLKQIFATTGEQQAALSSIGLTELVHGIYRAQSVESRARASHSSRNCWPTWKLSLTPRIRRW